MIQALTIIEIVLALILMLVILLQPSKSEGLSGSIAGGAEQLFGKRKSRGYEKLLHNLTIVFSVLTFGNAIALTLIIH